MKIYIYIYWLKKKKILFLEGKGLQHCIQYEWLKFTVETTYCSFLAGGLEKCLPLYCHIGALASEVGIFGKAISAQYLII